MLVLELIDAVVRNGDADKLRNGIPSGVFDREEEPIVPKGKERGERTEVVGGGGRWSVALGNSYARQLRGRGSGSGSGSGMKEVTA